MVLARTSSDLRHLAHVPVRVVQGHLGDLDALKAAMRGVTLVFHCAAASTDWAPMKTFFDANVHGTENLLKAAETNSELKRFVHVSTTDIYGYPPVPCTESHPSTDVGLGYIHTKVLGEAAVWAAHRENGLPVTIMRPATIYGPRGKAFVTDVAELLRIRLMAYIDDGQRTGGFTCVDTVAEAMMQAAESERTLGMAYNLSDETGGTWRDYVIGLASGLGYRAPWLNLSFRSAMLLASAMEYPHGTLKLPGHPLLTRHAVYLLGRDQEFPNDKARRDFGFSPTVDLTEGIKRSVVWLNSLSNLDPNLTRIL